MNVLILGAGTIGTSIAELLGRQDINVVVVDSDPQQTDRINGELDVRAICGSASQSSVLFQAGAAAADICLAVTGNDEVNLVAGSIAKAMGAKRSIARVYGPVFRDLSTFDYQRHFQIDRLLSVEHLTAMEMARSIRQPSSVVVEHFARGGLEIHDIPMTREGPMTRQPIRQLGLPSYVRIGTIHRGQRTWIPTADDQVELGDLITVVGRPQDMESIRSYFHSSPAPKKRIVVAGGGETGFHLARTMEREGYSVLIMDADRQRCEFLASALNRGTVVHCDATRRDVMEEERVGQADVFAACTGDDEDNIMLGVEARELGAKKIMAVVGRPDYANVVGKLGIDVAVSEREVMAKEVQSYLHSGPIVSRFRLPNGLVNVVEVEVLNETPITRTSLANSALPERCLIAAVIRQDYIQVPGADDILQPGDIAVLLVEEDKLDDALDNFSPSPAQRTERQQPTTLRAHP